LGHRQRGGGKALGGGAQQATDATQIPGAAGYPAKDLPAAAYNAAGIAPSGVSGQKAHRGAKAGGANAAGDAPTMDELNVRFGRFGLGPEELQQVASAGLTPEEASELEMRLAQETGIPPADPSEYSGMSSTTSDPAASGPGWSPEWEQKYTQLFQQYNIPPQYIKQITNGLKKAGMSDTELQQKYDYLTQTPQGQAEMQQTVQLIEQQMQQQQTMEHPPGVKAIGMAVAAKLAKPVGLAAAGYAAWQITQKVLANKLADKVVEARKSGDAAATRVAEEQLAAKRRMLGKAGLNAQRRLGLAPVSELRESSTSRALELLRTNELRGNSIKGLTETVGSGASKRTVAEILAEGEHDPQFRSALNKAARANGVKGIGIKTPVAGDADGVLSQLAKKGGFEISKPNYASTMQLGGETFDHGKYVSAVENKRSINMLSHPINRWKAAGAAFEASPAHHIYSTSKGWSRLSAPGRALQSQFSAFPKAGTGVNGVEAVASGSAWKGVGNAIKSGSKVGKGTALLGAAFGAYEGWNQYKKDGHWSKEVSEKAGEGVGSTVGGMAGWQVGAVLGAEIGTAIPVPVVGTAVGAIAGGLIGGFIGSKAGGEVGHIVGGGLHSAVEGVKSLF
jgi:hypothetical protein